MPRVAATQTAASASARATSETSSTGSKVLHSTQEASRRLGISVSTLTKWRLTGAGPRFVKLGSRVGYRDEDLDAFVTDRIRRSTSDTGASGRHAPGDAASPANAA